MCHKDTGTQSVFKVQETGKGFREGKIKELGRKNEELVVSMTVENERICNAGGRKVEKELTCSR